MSIYSRYELHADAYMNDVGKAFDPTCSLAANAKEVMLLDRPFTCPHCETILSQYILCGRC